MSDRALRCADCRAETRLFSDSLFERSKLPLEIWFAAAWYLTNQRGGVSALGLQRALGLGSYRTAWTLTHKLRRAMIAPDATVRTDAASIYSILASHGYQHWAVTVAHSDDDAHVAMPAVHRVASLLKRWLIGTHQGAVQAHQLDAYLDEYAFRFNRRRAGHVGLLFHRLLQHAITHQPEPYTTIRGGPGER